MTECNPEQLEFHGLGRRSVVGRFDGGRISSDGGGTLLREADLRIGLTARLSGCFTDHRNPLSVEHDVHTLLAQRIYGVALGYEDLNDHDVLRSDSVLALLSFSASAWKRANVAIACAIRTNRIWREMVRLIRRDVVY